MMPSTLHPTPDQPPPAPATTTTTERPTATPTSDSDVTDRFVTANGLRFHYRERGDAGAPAVLLLHGLTGNAWEWDPVAAALARRYHVIALDQRGHGASGWAETYAAEEMATDLAAVTAGLGLESVTVVGHSMGGINALLLTATRPELVARLVLVDIGPDSLTPEACAWWADSLDASARAAYADPEEALREWQAADPLAREAELRHFIVHNLAHRADGRWGWRFDAARVAGFFTPPPSPSRLWAAIQGVTCPTLVIRGPHSPVLSAATATRMTSQLPDGHLTELPGGAHDLTVEQPHTLTRAVDTFLP